MKLAQPIGKVRSLWRCSWPVQLFLVLALGFILAVMGVTSLNAQGPSYDTAQRCREIATTKKTLSDQRQQSQALLKYEKFFQGQLSRAPNKPSIADIDKYMNADKRFKEFLQSELHGEPPTPAMKALFAVIGKDQDYWTARHLEAEFTSIGNPRLDYPGNLREDIAALEETVNNLDLRLGNLDAQAQALNCPTTGVTPPGGAQTSPSSGSSSNTGATPPSGSNSSSSSTAGSLRIKVVTTLSCSGADLQAPGAGNVTVQFFADPPGSKLPIGITTGADGTTGSTPLRLDPGKYIVKVSPKFGNLAWVRLHLVSDPGIGWDFDYDANVDGVHVTFAPASNPGVEEYQLALRLTSPQACTQ